MIPLILIPGHLSDARLYAPQMAALAGRAEVTLAETREDESLPAMAARLLATAPPHFAVAGLSMGGMVAMEVVAAAPGRVLAAGLIATDPTPARERERVWRAGLVAEGFATYVERFVAAFFGHAPDVAARLTPPVTEMMLDAGEAVWRRQSAALDRRRDMGPLIAGWPGAALVLCGAEDRVCPPKLHVALASLLPGAVLEMVPGCGHIATLERPDAVNAALLRLLDQVSSADRAS